MNARPFCNVAKIGAPCPQRRSATPFGCRYDRTIIIIVTHEFPYSSKTASVDRAAVKAGGAPWNIAKATSEERPNGRSIGRTRDNYYYRHPAIFRAGCKTARGNFVNAIKITAQERSETSQGRLDLACEGRRRASRGAKSRYRSTVIAIDESPAKECVAYDKGEERERERNRERSAKLETFTVCNPDSVDRGKFL